MKRQSLYIPWQQNCDFFTISKFVFAKMCPPLPTLHKVPYLAPCPFHFLAGTLKVHLVTVASLVIIGNGSSLTPMLLKWPRLKSQRLQDNLSRRWDLDMESQRVNLFIWIEPWRVQHRVHPEFSPSSPHQDDILSSPLEGIKRSFTGSWWG